MPLHYKEINPEISSEVMFIFHTSPLDSTYLVNSVNEELNSIRLIFIDLPGHGESTLEDMGELAWTNIATLADELRSNLSVEKIHLLGHGIGGFVAQQYAILFPNRVSNLILVNSSPNAKYREKMAWNIRQKYNKVTIQALEQYRGETDDKSLRVRFTQSLATYFDPVDHENAKYLMDSASSIGTDAYVELSKDIIPNTDFRKQLRSIKNSVLIISSTKDVWPPNASQLLRNDIIDADYVELPTGHFPMIDEPQLFWDAVKSFVIP